MRIVAPCVRIEPPQPRSSNAASDDVVVRRLTERNQALTWVSHSNMYEPVQVQQIVIAIPLHQERQFLLTCGEIHPSTSPGRSDCVPVSWMRAWHAEL